MSSKVIGFRVPEDIAEELEKVSKEHGTTIADFLRSLVDETLYPSTNLHDKENDDITREQMESLSNAHRDLTADVQKLSVVVDRIEAKIAGYEINGIHSPNMVEAIQEIEAIKSNTKKLVDKVDTLSIKLESAQNDIMSINRHEESLDRSYTELQKEVSIVGLQLAAVSNLSTKVKQLESEATRLTTTTSLIKREIKRQPTDEIRTLPYTDGIEHRFRVYKSKAGLKKPHRVTRDPVSGDKYIDETEPLD